MDNIIVRVVESKPYTGQECNVKARDDNGRLYCLKLVNPPPVNTNISGILRDRIAGNTEGITPTQSNIVLVGNTYYWRN